MARDDLHFRLRIPEKLKGLIEQAATSNNRSLTAEIVSRLERSFDIVPEWENAIANVNDLWLRVEALEKNDMEQDDRLREVNAYMRVR